MTPRPHLSRPAIAEPRALRRPTLIDAGLVAVSAAFAVLVYQAITARSHRVPALAASVARPETRAPDALPPTAASAAAVFRARIAAGATWADELRTWAAADPAGALSWARSLRDGTRVGAIIAALEGATTKPEEAVRLARALLAAEPGLAADCEPALVGALIRANAFGVALDFVQTGPAELRAASLTTLFAAWVRRDPAFAGELATMFGAEGLRGHAFDAVMRSWATVAPTQAIAFALRLPAGEGRQVAFRAALPPWVAQHPDAVAEQLPKLADAAERDAATCALVCATDTLNRTTMTALAWTESIGDPAMRLQALQHVLPEWAAQDSAAARVYLETAALPSAERENLRALLRPRAPGDDL